MDTKTAVFYAVAIGLGIILYEEVFYSIISDTVASAKGSA